MTHPTLTNWCTENTYARCTFANRCWFAASCLTHSQQSKPFRGWANRACFLTIISHVPTKQRSGQDLNGYIFHHSKTLRGTSWVTRYLPALVPKRRRQNSNCLQGGAQWMLQNIMFSTIISNDVWANIEWCQYVVGGSTEVSNDFHESIEWLSWKYRIVSIRGAGRPSYICCKLRNEFDLMISKRISNVQQKYRKVHGPTSMPPPRRAYGIVSVLSLVVQPFMSSPRIVMD